MSDKRARATDYAQAIIQAMMERWQSSLTQVAHAASRGSISDIQSVLPQDSAPELVNALKLMQQRGDLDLVKDVATALGQIVSGRSEPLKAEIVSASALSDQEQEQIKASLIEKHGDGLLFSFRVDPSLLGGLRVRVGDSLLDTSVATRLTALRESLASVTR